MAGVADQRCVPIGRKRQVVAEVVFGFVIGSAELGLLSPCRARAGVDPYGVLPFFADQSGIPVFRDGHARAKEMSSGAFPR